MRGSSGSGHTAEFAAVTDNLEDVCAQADTLSLALYGTEAPAVFASAAGNPDGLEPISRGARTPRPY